jgi:hypothetical protein
LLPIDCSIKPPFGVVSGMAWVEPNPLVLDWGNGRGNKKPSGVKLPKI